jgi:hypothetical protein
MTIKGDGVGSASKLRLRTPDHRWIEIPYGAGQDSEVRSINVWDGSAWKCPTWGRLLWPDMFTDPGLLAELDSMQIKMPIINVYWSGYFDPSLGGRNDHYFNPNFRYLEGGIQWTIAYEANWQRLFYLTVRSDPRYRIVPLHYPLPRAVPNITLHFEDMPYGDFQAFWPAVTFVSERYDDGVQTQIENGVIDLNYADDSYPQLAAYSSNFIPGPAVINNGDQTSTLRITNKVSSIDMKAIRQRISAVYPYQDVTFTGQKNNIDQQDLRRVIVKLKIGVLVWWFGEEIPEVIGNDFDNVQFLLRSSGNIDTFPEVVPEQVFTDGQYPPVTVNIPSSTDPDGLSIWSATAAQFNHTIVGTHLQTGQVGYGTDRYWTWYQIYGTTDIEYSFEAPGENSIGFYAEINNPVGPHDYYSQVLMQFSVGIDRICLQYADTNVDIPADLIRWDALPGSPTDGLA